MTKVTATDANIDHHYSRECDWKPVTLSIMTKATTSMTNIETKSIIPKLSWCQNLSVHEYRHWIQCFMGLYVQTCFSLLYIFKTRPLLVSVSWHIIQFTNLVEPLDSNNWFWFFYCFQVWCKPTKLICVLCPSNLASLWWQWNKKELWCSWPPSNNDNDTHGLFDANTKYFLLKWLLQQFSTRFTQIPNVVNACNPSWHYNRIFGSLLNTWCSQDNLQYL